MGTQLFVLPKGLSLSLLLQERHQLSGALSSLGLEHQLDVEVAGDPVRAQAAAPGPRVAFTFESQDSFSCNPPQQPSGGTILKWKQLLNRGWKVRSAGLCARPQAPWLHLAVRCCKLCAICKASIAVLAAAQIHIVVTYYTVCWGSVLTDHLLVTPCWLLQYQPHLL